MTAYLLYLQQMYDREKAAAAHNYEIYEREKAKVWEIQNQLAGLMHEYESLKTWAMNEKSQNEQLRIEIFTMGSGRNAYS